MSAPDRDRWGTGCALAAYLSWGVFPLYFHALRPAGPVEIVAHRVLWSLLVCLALMGLARRTGRPAGLVRDRRQLTLLGVASVAIAVNWGLYVYGVNSGHAVETALGYFINPLVTVLAGVVVLGERLSRLRWVAMGLGTVAVVVLTLGYGHPPWIALSLAVSFATYSLMKKRVGAGVQALSSLTTETLLLAPIAAGAVLWLELTSRGTVTEHAPGHALLLLSTGVATAIPLLLFAEAARRVPLATIGLLQFITPVLQLLCGVLVLHEYVPPSRWVGFSLVWLALVVLTVETVRTAGRNRRSRAAARA